MITVAEAEIKKLEAAIAIQKEKMNRKKAAIDDKQKVKDLISEAIHAKKTQNQQIIDDTEQKKELALDIKEKLRQLNKPSEKQYDFTMSIAQESTGEMRVPEDEDDADEELEQVYENNVYRSS